MAAVALLIPACFGCFFLIVIGGTFAGLWKVFEKAGQPGWAGIVPVYNFYILTIEIAKKEILWFILMFVPIANIVASVMVSIDVAKRFGKTEAYGVGMALLPFVFYPMLGFSDARYDNSPPAGGGAQQQW